MRILVTTQAVDTEDPLLGFFHEWLARLSEHAEEIHVVCLKKGAYALPPNVHVHSLGKERGASRFGYIGRFFQIVWKLRHTCDVVFSHMNPHYIVLGGWLWKWQGTRVFFWRNHAQMNVMTWIAAQYANRVFYTSPYACTRRFRHAVQMPVGIDTRMFAPDPASAPKRDAVLFLGRLSPVKRPMLFLEAMETLKNFSVDIYGSVPPQWGIDPQSLEAHSREHIRFHSSVSHHETPALYRSHEFYVNLTKEGSMDKTIFEAAACGALVLVTNPACIGMIPPLCHVRDDSPAGIRSALVALASLSQDEKRAYRKQLRDMVEREHSLELLVKQLVSYFTNRI